MLGMHSLQPGEQAGDPGATPASAAHLRSGSQPLSIHCGGAAISVLTGGQLHHRGAQAAGHQLGLELLDQLLRRCLTGAVAIESNEEVFHPLALQELQLQR